MMKSNFSRVTYDDVTKRQIGRFARRVLRRAKSAGAASILIEDIESELMIAWCKARDKWNDSVGVPFAAYLARGMMNHINTWLDGEIGFRNLAPLSLDNSRAGFKNLHDTVEDETVERIDQKVEEQNIRDVIIPRLSPTTRKFVELLDTPPYFLFEEMSASKARSNYAKSRGIKQSISLNRITAALVFDFMGLALWDRKLVYEELDQIIPRAKILVGE
jgi:hypothetical protein